MSSEPKSTIRYLFNGSINLNNRDSDLSYSAAETIEHLRQAYLDSYLWDGEIVFFPNCYYAKRTVFENMREQGRNLYTNSKNLNAPSFRGYDFKKIECPSEMEPNVPNFLHWEGELTKNFKIPRNVYLFRVLEWGNKDTYLCDAFCTRPLEGVSLLGFVLNELNPIYMGSGTVTLAGRENYQVMGNFCQIFECGTGNTPLLLYLYDITPTE